MTAFNFSFPFTENMILTMIPRLTQAEPHLKKRNSLNWCITLKWALLLIFILLTHISNCQPVTDQQKIDQWCGQRFNSDRQSCLDLLRRWCDQTHGNAASDPSAHEPEICRSYRATGGGAGGPVPVAPAPVPAPAQVDPGPQIEAGSDLHFMPILGTVATTATANAITATTDSSSTSSAAIIFVQYR